MVQAVDWSHAVVLDLLVFLPRDFTSSVGFKQSVQMPSTADFKISN